MAKEKHLVFSVNTLRTALDTDAYSMTSAKIKFYMSADNKIVPVTDITETKLMAEQLVTGKEDKYYGVESAFKGQLTEMTVSELARGSTSNDVALFTMIMFKEKSVEDFFSFMQIHLGVSGVRLTSTLGELLSLDK